MTYLLNFGSANAGGAPAFLFFADTDGAALAQPAIVEIGGGWYKFDHDPKVTTVYAVALNGVELADVLRAAVYSQQPLLHLLNFGFANAGGAPVFSKFADVAGTAIAQPAITAIGGGWYKFSYTPAVTTIYTVGLNGTELSEVIEAPLAILAADLVIANLALDHLGITNKIASVDEQTEPARAVARWYHSVRRDLLRYRPWSFPGSEKRAALVEDAVNTHPQYEYAYVLPDDMLKPRKLIVENYRSVPPQWEVPFYVGNIAGGSSRRLYADLSSAVLAYTPDITSVDALPDYLTTAFSYVLAEVLIAPLRVADKRVIERVLFGRAVALGSAVIEDKAQHQSDPDPEPSWLLERY